MPETIENQHLKAKLYGAKWNQSIWRLIKVERKTEAPEPNFNSVRGTMLPQWYNVEFGLPGNPEEYDSLTLLCEHKEKSSVMFNQRYWLVGIVRF